jgi:hypothetical protein
MAVNRVVLQHFSLNLEDLLENREPRLSTSSTDDDNYPYGHISDSKSELSESRSSSEFEQRSGGLKSEKIDGKGQPSEKIGIVGKPRIVIGKESLNLFGLSPPSESRLMQRRLKARSDLLQRQSAPIVASPSG